MNRFFLSIVSLLVSLSMSGQLPFQKSEVKEVMKKVADWQIAHQKDVKHSRSHIMRRSVRWSACGSPFLLRFA